VRSTRLPLLLLPPLLPLSPRSSHGHSGVWDLSAFAHHGQLFHLASPEGGFRYTLALCGAAGAAAPAACEDGARSWPRTRTGSGAAACLADARLATCIGSPIPPEPQAGTTFRRSSPRPRSSKTTGVRAAAGDVGCLSAAAHIDAAASRHSRPLALPRGCHA
jgi:hypothetical protein